MSVPGYDRANDPSPDVVSVEVKDDKYRVRHYPTLETKRPCCEVVVQITAADRRYLYGPEIAALKRADLKILEKHNASTQT
jgi:hypothetical protein